MKESIRQGVTKLADLNYQYVYPYFARSVSTLTDRFPGTANVMSPFMIYSEEILAANTLRLFYILGKQFLEGNPHLASPEAMTGTLAQVGALAALTFSIAIGNFLRTPIDKKMGLKPDKFSPGPEIGFLISQLNKRSEVDTLSFQETVPLARKAVDDFTLKHEGVKVDSAHQIQSAYLPNLMLWRMHTLGFFNPLSQEIVFTTEEFPEAIAHEFAHSKGIPQEKLAQFVGVASQIENEHPYLQYLGYLSWLDLVTDAATEQMPRLSKMKRPERTEWIISRLTQDGLNKRSVDDLQARSEFMSQVDTKIMSYSYLTNILTNTLYNLLPPTLQARIPAEIVEFCKNPERGIGGFHTEMMMSITGQKDSKAAYVRGPVLLLHDYRDKYLR